MMNTEDVVGNGHSGLKLLFHLYMVMDLDLFGIHQVQGHMMFMPMGKLKVKRRGRYGGLIEKEFASTSWSMSLESNILLLNRH